MNEAVHRDLTSVVLAVLLIGLLIIAAFLVMQPFIPALIWAGTIVIASWQLHMKVERRLGGSRALSTTVMTSLLIIALILPLTIAFTAISDNIGLIKDKVHEVSVNGMPPPPAWVADVPLVGEKISHHWAEAATWSRDEVFSRASPFLRNAVSWVMAQLGGLGRIVVHFLLTVVIAAILYANGETAAAGIRAFARRLARERGEEAVVLAASSVSAVASGVVITALIQAISTGLGLIVTGIPYAVILTSITFLLCIIQVGAWPVLFGSVAWLFYQESTFAAWFLLVWSIAVLVSDNFIRPFLIRRGANLPLILIFAGVIGGLIAFGIIGLFVGPVVLAVGYTLIRAWTNEGRVAA